MPANTPTNDNFLEAGLLDEKRVLQTPSSNPSGQAAQQNRNMTAIRRLLVALTVSVLVTVAVARTYPVPCGLHHNGDAEAQAAPNVVASQDDSTFAQLLRSASPESLHRLLHDYLPEKFQHGVFPSDKEAVEAVHDDSAALATSIVQIAKRQNNNNSTVEETSDEPTQEPTPDPTTKDPEPTTESKEPTKPPTTSNPPPTSKTPDPTPSEPTPTPTPTDNDPVPTTQPPSSTSSSRSSSSSPSPTRSDSTTSRRTTSRSATVDTKTSTLPGGGVTTITSTSYYDLPPEATGDSSDPELQNAAPRSAVALIPMIFGMLAAMAL